MTDLEIAEAEIAMGQAYITYIKANKSFGQSLQSKTDYPTVLARSTAYKGLVKSVGEYLTKTGTIDGL